MLDEFFVAFKNAIFMFNAHNVIIACGGECGKEFRPIHVTETRQSRNLSTHALGQHSIVIESFMVNVQILDMHMENLVSKLMDHALIIDHFPDQVLWIEVQTKVVSGDDLPHFAQAAHIRKMKSAQSKRRRWFIVKRKC